MDLSADNARLFFYNHPLLVQFVLKNHSMTNVRESYLLESLFRDFWVYKEGKANANLSGGREKVQTKWTETIAVWIKEVVRHAK